VLTASTVPSTAPAAIEPAAPVIPAEAPDAALPGTGPSDESVPYGDPTTPHPAEPIAAAHVAGSTPPAGVRSRRHAASTGAEPASRRRGVVRHLLGVLVGLVVGAIGVWVTLFGQSRILGAQAPGWDASYDPIGVVLVTAGVLVLAVVLALGLWTPAVPMASGLVAAVVGVVYLYVPATTHADTIRWFATDDTVVSVTRATVTATSGTVFVVGALLFVAGLVLAVARRRWLPHV